MSNIVVTGAAGFLGSHLMLKHIELGDNVLGLDNYSTSSPKSEHSYVLGDLVKYCDITQAELIHEYTQQFSDQYGKIDLIYNFACPASPPKYQELAVETMQCCSIGVKNMLDLAKEHNAVFVQASTSEVYGDPNCNPQNEKYWGNVNSYGQRSMYDEGKRYAEALCWVYKNQPIGVDARVVRIFNTYGPHMDPNDGRVITNFVKQALRGEPITIYGDGKQTRSFCYVDDLIDAITIMGSLKHNPGVPINIGNDKEFTMIELANRVLKLTGSKSTLLFKQLPVDDPTQRRPDLNNARKLLNWWPIEDLDEGLKKMIEYMRTV